MTGFLGVSAAANRRGVAAVIAAMFFFALNDMFMKWSTERMPVPEVILLRSGFAFAIAACIVGITKSFRPKALRDNPFIFVRALCEMMLIITYTNALKLLPLGETTAITQSIPIFMTAWSAFVWKQKVSPPRWIAVFIGFCGVLLILRPTTSGIETPMLLALAAALCAMGRDLSTRRISRDIPSMMIASVSTLASTAAGLALLAFSPWKTPDGLDYVLVGSAATVVTGANLTIILAYRGTDVSLVAPFRYSAVPFALFVGFVVWGHLPDEVSWIGILIIVSAGVYTIVGDRLATRFRKAV